MKKIKRKYVLMFFLIDTSLLLLTISYFLNRFKKNEIPIYIILIYIILTICLGKFLYKECYNKYTTEYVSYCKNVGFIEVKKPQFYENYTIGYINYFKNKVKINVLTQKYDSKNDISNVSSIEKLKY